MLQASSNSVSVYSRSARARPIIVRDVIGPVEGSSVRARTFVFDFTAMFRVIFGGEVKEYSRLLRQSREQALERLKANASKVDADAVVCVRYATSQVMEGSSEMLAYGTAVKLG